MSKEEQYMEWLERLEVPIEETVSIKRLQLYLEDILFPTEARVEALWGAVERKYAELAPEGVTPITIDYPWGSQVRYLVPGYPGLLGYEGMMRILMGEE